MVCYHLSVDVLCERAFTRLVELCRLCNKLAAKVDKLDDIADKADDRQGSLL